MGKGKPRWYPDKPQNNYDKYCECFDGLEEKSIDEYLVTERCDVPHSVILKTCRCNPHKCMKALNKCMAGKDPKKKYYKGCSWNQNLIDKEIYGNILPDPRLFGYVLDNPPLPDWTKENDPSMSDKLNGITVKKWWDKK